MERGREDLQPEMLAVAIVGLALVCWLWRDYQHSRFTQVPVEGVISAAVLLVSATSHEWDICGLLAGVILATLHRYILHRVLHALPRWSVRHQRNHNHVRRRQLNGSFNATGLCESAFAALSVAFLPVSAAVWIGMLLEHVLEERVRTHILLGMSTRYGRWPRSVQRFWATLDTAYWLHVMVDDQSNLCFLCPFWDRLFGSHFLKRHGYTSHETSTDQTWWFPRSLPLPFWDYTVGGEDLHPWRVLVDRAFCAYVTAPDLWRQSIPKLPL